jgi:glycosyltransferase involved in cell wall biosynthesis
MTPVISIVIPTYYEEKIIGSTLTSLKSQLTIPHEIIISDGGSKDQTVKIAAKYADKLFVYKGIERQTIAQGRNDGARVARGEFLVFLDADCFIRNPDSFFRTAISNFDRVSKLVALTGLLRVLPENETISDKVITGVVNSIVLVKNNILHKAEVPGGEFQMIPRQAFDKVGGYDEELVTREDRDIFFRLSKIGRTLCDSRLTVFHTGRRAHHYGWAHMIGLLIVNTLSYHVRGRIRSKEWTLVR